VRLEPGSVRPEALRYAEARQASRSCDLCLGSDRLLAYWSVRCRGAGSSSSSTIGYVAVRSVTTRNGCHQGRADSLLEEPAGRLGVLVCRHDHVDHLAKLVDRAVDVAPPAGDLHVGLVDEPATPDGIVASVQNASPTSTRVEADPTLRARSGSKPPMVDALRGVQATKWRTTKALIARCNAHCGDPVAAEVPAQRD
jgi:hypothetical protein